MPTLAQDYNNGSSSTDQTLLIAAAKGGPVQVKANSSGVGSLLKALTSAAGVLLDLTDNAAQVVRSAMPDSASAVALAVDTLSAWSNASAKLQSWRNNAVEKAFMLASGDFWAAGMVLENLPSFGSPMVRGQATNGYMSFTSDGVGTLWGGTGVTCRQQATGPEISTIELTIDDVPVASVQPGVMIANKFGAGAGQTRTISGGVLTPSPDFGAVSFVGAGTIDTITSENQSYWIEIIPTDTFNWTTSGNIALAGAAQVGRLLRFWHDNGTGKWYPSYT